MLSNQATKKIQIHIAIFIYRRIVRYIICNLPEMPTRKEVLMRSANLLNDFAFKYVFGEDCKEANDALKSLLTVFLERKVNHVVVKNSEMVKDYSKMKSSRLDLLVEFNDKTTVDLEMQLRQTKDNMMNRFSYYLARLHGSQDMEGKSYGQLKETIVMIFFNVNIVENDNICNTFRLKCDGDLPLVKEEKEDCMKLRAIEMPKVDLNKPLEDMNEQEKMIYYFLNCQKGMDDSKIKVMIESDGVIQMLEKRVETISDDGWKKIIEDFQKLHENEERIELQLELEETQRQMKEVQKEKEKAEKKVEEKDQEIKQMIQVMLANGMSLELISKSLSKSEDEIMELLK